MYFPSRDQSLGMTRPSSVSKSVFSSPWPLAGFSRRLNLPSRSEAKTIRVPSGDHTGQMLFPAPNVKRELTPRARSRTQMSFFPLRASVSSKARCLPSRENAGFP